MTKPHALAAMAVTILSNIIVPNLVDDRVDSYCWRVQDGSFTTFSMKHVWQCIRDTLLDIVFTLVNRFEKKKSYNVERAKTREMSEPSLVRRLLLNRRRIGATETGLLDFLAFSFLNDKVAAGGYRQVKVLEFFDCPGLRQGVEDLRELLHKQRVKRMASMNTKLNIKKLDGNIVQKHGGSKQVGFKQLGPRVKTGVHGVHDEKLAQRRLEDKQPKEKTNTNYLVKEQEKEYQTRWKIKMGNVLDSCNQKSTQQCMKSKVTKHLGVAGLQQQNGNMGFNKSREYKKAFIGSGVGTGSMKVLRGFKFEGATLAFKLFRYREDSNEAAFVVVVVEKIYAHDSLTFNDTVACEVISKWKARWHGISCGCTTEIWVTKGLLDKTKGNVLGMEIVRDQSGNTLRVSQSRFYNKKLIQTMLEGHSILSLEGSLSGVCDVEKNDVGMLDKFDHGLQTDVQVFVDFDYAMGRSITVMGYMTFTKAWKKKIWLKKLLTESGYELRLVASIATGTLVKGSSRSEVPAQVEVCIPRHAIHLWLVMKRHLPTQDKLRQWNVGNSIDLNLLRCPLYKSEPDSHDYLFFECTFSSLDWSSVVQRADIGFSSWRCCDIMAFLILNKTRVNRSKHNAPPRAKGAWPIIGHLHLLGGSRPAQQVLGDLADKYGPIFTIKLGFHQALVVSSGEIAKECYTTNDKVFASRPKSKAVEIMGYNYAMFGLAPYGDYWRQVRKIITLEVLSQRRVEMLGHVRESELKASLKDIHDAWENNKESEGSNMVKVDMKQWFGTLVLNIVVRVISGKRFPTNDEEGIHFQNVIRKNFELLGAFVASDYIPYMDRFDLGGHEKEMMLVWKEMDNIMDGWLQEHRREIESGQQLERNQVFLDVLISSFQGAPKEDFPGFDHDTALITAGLDTTSVTLTWALSLLLNNPKALKAVQEEIDEHVGRDRPVVESDMKNLFYLEAVIKETLRLYPAGPLAVPHESMEDCVLSGYNVPKGTRLLINLWKLQRDPNIWPDPDEFKPERFMTTDKHIDVKGKHYELLPFGSGRRMCPGVFFALQALHLTLATLIQQFELVKPSDEQIDTSKSSGLTTSKATPLEVLLSPRSSLNTAVVRLTEPKMKILGEKGIDCIFIGYDEHSKCYRFYVIKPNDYVSVNSIIESRDAIFDEERFTSIPRPRGMIQPSSSKITKDEVEGTDDVPGLSVPRKNTRTRKAKSFGSNFQLYLVKGTRDKTLSLHEYCFIIEENPR
nr:cytochrome P450 CYP82D47-like [Tanacetum cinerariifolium]